MFALFYIMLLCYYQEQQILTASGRHLCNCRGDALFGSESHQLS